MFMRVHVLHKMSHQEISHRGRSVDVIEMYQKACCFAHKTIYFFSLPHCHHSHGRSSSLLSWIVTLQIKILIF